MKYFFFQGKFLEVSFDFKGDPTGAHITNCKYPKKVFFINHLLICHLIFTDLLEKSRIIHHPTKERTFHIFYQLLAGADIQLLSKLLILNMYLIPIYYYKIALLMSKKRQLYLSFGDTVSRWSPIEGVRPRSY